MAMQGGPIREAQGKQKLDRSLPNALFATVHRFV